MGSDLISADSPGNRSDPFSSAEIKARALELGFDLCGISGVGDFDELLHLPAWLANGYAGRMTYLHRTAKRRGDVRRWLPSAQSVIVVACHYNTNRPYSTEVVDPGVALVSRYAWGEDYHRVMTGRLMRLLEWMRASSSAPFEWRMGGDTEPIQERAYAHSLYSLLDDEQKDRGLPPASWNPFKWNREKQTDFAVTYGLTAIGVCLMLGLCTPLAALGGACFMCSVVLSQFPFPTVYPHAPPVVGHSLLVNKDFIEMIALLVVAATRAGRWGGLDVFVSRWIVGPFLSRKSRKTK